jgi:hypothetical protein
MTNWFSVVLIFEAEVDGICPLDALCEASIRVVEAPDAESAKGKAATLGFQAEHNYQNDMGQMVQWRFREVVEVQDLGETSIDDGIEIYSRMFRKNESKSPDLPT